MAIVLLFVRSYRAFLRSSREKLGGCLCFTDCSHWTHSLGPDGGYEGRQEQFWEDLFANPSEWWDNRVDKRTSRHPDFRHKRTREPLWLNNQYKPVWVDSRLASLSPQLHSGLQGTEFPLSDLSRRLGNELESLCEEGQLDKALDVLSDREQQGTLPPVRVYSSLLKACTRRGLLAQTKQLHSHLAKYRLDCTRFVGEHLVSALMKCGGLNDGLQVFYNLPCRTAFSWTAVISGYNMAGQGQEALRMYQCMQAEGLRPDNYTFVSILRACGSLSNLTEGKRMHAEAVKYGWESNLFVGTRLVQMYAKCGSLVDAQHVFDGLSQRDVVLWNVMIGAYAQQGNAEKSLQLYDQMCEEAVSPNDRTFVTTLLACGMLAEMEEVVVDGEMIGVKKYLEKGRAVHADARKKGYECDVFVSNTLISMYGKYGRLVDARMVFDRLHQKNVVSWNAMLGVYAQQGQPEKALQLYEQMRETDVSPDDRTLVSALQACGMVGETEDDALHGEWTRQKVQGKAKAVHADAKKKGYDSDVFVGSTLISAYGKCGCIMDAKSVFDGLLSRNVVSWNAMLGAYAVQDQAENAVQLYDQMQKEGVSSDVRTFVTVLHACGILAEKEMCTGDEHTLKVNSLKMGKAIHDEARGKGYHSNVFVGSTLISMYGKCGSISDAVHVFNGLCHRNVVVWTAMLSAFVEQGNKEKALQLYKQMLECYVVPDEITLVCILQVCSSTGGLDMCRQIHHNLVSSGKKLSTILANTLIHAYGRCASIVDSQTVFDELPQPNVVSWTALIASYAREGNCEASLQCYEDMLLAGMKPNAVTFLSLLSACSHAGLVDKGIEYFESMTRDHHLSPKIEHYATMVDLLGGAGYFDRVKDLISTLPMQPDMAMMLCLLGACRKHSKVGLGKEAFDCAVSLQPNCSAAYVLMFHIYSDAGLWDRATEIHVLRRKAGALKNPGQSWMELQQEVYTFSVSDCNHPQKEEVYDLVVKVNLELKVGQDVLGTNYYVSHIEERFEQALFCEPLAHLCVS